MDDRKVIPFRKRRPSEAQLQVYRHMTRSWHPEMRQLLLPEYFKLDTPPAKR